MYVSQYLVQSESEMDSTTLYHAVLFTNFTLKFKLELNFSQENSNENSTQLGLNGFQVVKHHSNPNP